MQAIEIFGMSISIWLYAPLVFFIWISVGYTLKRVFFKFVRKLTKNTKTNFDDIIIKAADFPVNLLIFASGGVVVESVLPYIADPQMTRYIIIGLKTVVIIAVIMFMDRAINGLLKEYSNKIEILSSTGQAGRAVVRVVVIGIGIMILLDSLGVSITPLIASLGIGSLAVALALQPTLENFFSGVQLIIDKPIKLGQFVKLDSGEEGYVHKIGWRSTWIRMLPNNMVIIPNKNLVDAKITNFYYPEMEMSALVQVGVHYSSDLEKVERVTIEVGKETLQEVEGGVGEFEPFIRYHTFDNSSINFSVILRVKEFVNQYLIKHEFIKRLSKRYNEEGIVIPFPIRAINYSQEKSFENQEREATRK